MLGIVATMFGIIAANEAQPSFIDDLIGAENAWIVIVAVIVIIVILIIAFILKGYFSEVKKIEKSRSKSDAKTTKK
jgi:hypothetical protein